MRIIGCDFHPSYQQIAMLDSETGELWEGRLEHEGGQARRFYASLTGPVRVGMEAVGNSQWFESMLAEQKHELWIGDAAQIRRLVVRQQKTDRRDARHILDLLFHRRIQASESGLGKSKGSRGENKTPDARCTARARRCTP